MTDYVLIDRDLAIFQPSFGAAAVVVRPGPLTASGPATLRSTKLCIAGDERSVVVPGCPYSTPVYSLPGVGTLEIAALAPDQTAQKTRTGATPVLLVGSIFIAKFTVQNPAKQPPKGPVPPIPDAMPLYFGIGKFVTTNAKFRGV